MNDSPADTSRCVACGQSFRCGAEAGDARCWCFDMPRLPLRTGSTSCYCPDCLRKIVSRVTAPADPETDNG